MKSRTPVEGTLYALVSEEKKEKAPALNLEPTVVPMRSTTKRQLLTIDSE